MGGKSFLDLLCRSNAGMVDFGMTSLRGIGAKCGLYLESSWYNRTQKTRSELLRSKIDWR